MSFEIADRCALLVVDVQTGFDDPVWGDRNNPGAEARIAQLLVDFRNEGRPVIHVHHDSTLLQSPLHPNNPGNAVKQVAAPIDGEPQFRKQVNSSFIGTDLDQYAKRHAIDSFYVVGLTTDHCVSTTVRMGANLGFTMFVDAAATATFDRTDHNGAHYEAQLVHDLALASLHGEFATVITP